jgi:ABC-2 type transport system permease protein
MLRKYWVLININWQLLMEYRAGMVIWILANTLPLVMMAIWITLASAGPVGGFGVNDFVAYYLAVLLVRQLTTVWVAWELDNDIRLGDLSPKLLRPINPLHDHLALHLADKLFRLMAVVPLILAPMVYLPGLSYPLTPLTFGFFLLSLIGAFAIRFVSQYSIGLLSFWITQSLAINEMFFAGLLMFGGVIAPLSLFPPAIASWANFLPFRYMLALPVEILLGRLSQTQMLQALGGQGAWLLFWMLVTWWLWKAGIRRYSAVGS